MIRRVPPALRALFMGACAASVVAGTAAGAGGGTPGQVPALDASARGVGAILPGGNLATAVASRRHPTRSATATPRGPVASGGTVSVGLGAGPRDGGSLAEGEADASGVSLFGGRIVVNALHLGVRSQDSGQGAQAGVAAWSADVLVDGQQVGDQPGHQFEVPGVGTLVLGEQLVDSGTVTANALHVQVTDPASGQAPGTDVVLGHLEAVTGEGNTPSPDPGSAGSAPGAAGPATGDGGSSASTPGPGSTTGTTQGGLPVAPTPVTPSSPVTVTPSGGLGLPTQVAPSVSVVPTTQGYVFPVTGATANDFSDDYGNARADTGWHHGTDIFAPAGTPLVAVADGTLSKVGVNALGGNRLWLTDDHGTAYYYAHLSAYAPGTTDGVRVRAGQVIGFVGNTGDAVSTPPHLHFEVHPNDGDSVDPYPYLVAWLRNAPIAQAFQAATVAVGHTPASGTLLMSDAPLPEAVPGTADGTAVAVR